MTLGHAEALPSAPVDARLGAIEKRVFYKIAWRVLPLLTIAYIVNFLDRTNVAFAALTMNQDVGLSAAQFGYGAGILFLGYCLFEVPSNVALYKFGARRWLSRIMVTWGVVSVAMIFTAGPTSFYALRFLLGVAEAGFFPGAAFYLAQWFPPEYRARILAWFLLGIPASTMLGGPISSLLLEMDGTWGLAGWKWLFLVEGAPAIILGVAILISLVDKPDQASWLSDEEKTIVKARLSAEIKEREKRHLLASLADSRVLLLALIQFLFTVGSYGVGIFLPLILKAQQFSNFSIGFLTAIPSLIACVGMIYWAAAVDRSGRKITGLALTCLVSGTGLVIAVWSDSFVVSFLGLTAVVVGTNAARAILWTIPTRFLSGIGAAGGLAFINSIGVVGGFVGPSIMGFLKDATGSFDAGLMALSGSLFLAMAFAFSLKRLIVRE
jgi:ACS family tartrate transporter-like MFS transporter